MGVMIFAGLPNLNPLFGIPPGAPPVLGTGAAITDFLTGKLTQLHQANPNPENLTQNYFALYLQDTWKANRKLTLNYGVNASSASQVGRGSARRRSAAL